MSEPKPLGDTPIGVCHSGDIALVGGEAQTIICVRAREKALRIRGWRLLFHGTSSASGPAEVILEFQRDGEFRKRSRIPVQGQPERFLGGYFDTEMLAPPRTLAVFDRLWKPLFGGFVGWDYKADEVVINPGESFGFKIMTPQSVCCQVSVFCAE